MSYLLFLTILLNFRFHVRAHSLPVSRTGKRIIDGDYQEEEWEPISWSELRSRGEPSDQRQEKQAVKCVSLPKLANLKNLKNIPTWAVNHIRRPSSKFDISPCTCQNYSRLRDFCRGYARYNLLYSKRKATKALRPNTMFQIVMDRPGNVPPAKRLCMDCYILCLDHWGDQIYSLLQKNDMNDTILYLYEPRTNLVPSAGLPKHLRPVFGHRNYIPWAIKYYHCDIRLCKPASGVFSIPKYTSSLSFLGLDEYVLKQKQLVGDAFSYWRNSPYFELKEDLIVFLRRIFSTRNSSPRSSEWYTSFVNDDSRQNSPTSITDSELDLNLNDTWYSAHNSAVLPQAANGRMR